MTYDIDVIAKIISPLITLLLAVLKYLSERKSKLISFIGHISSFTLSDEKQTQVYTHSIIVRNTGRKSAINVRIGHNFLPPNIQVSPPVNYKIETNPAGSAEVIFPIIVPKEQITISYLYFPPITWEQVNAYTKSDDGFADIIKVIPIPQPSKLVTGIIWFLIFIGASSIIYWLVRKMLFLIS
jgi:hypothetical protein